MAKIYIGNTEIKAQGEGLSQTEKSLLLTLFEKAAYAEDDAGTAYTALSELWAEYSITWNGTGYAKSNSATSASAGASFTSTVTANTGFTVTNVTVMMGGNTVQGAWSNGRITIPNVTGDIVITVTTSQISVSSISAVYTQSGAVYSDTNIDSLKSDLVVTATFMDSSTGVIDPADYTLSGTLTEGTSTITVSYGGKTTTFNVTVTAEPVPTFALNRAIAIDGLTLSSGMINDNGEVVSINNSYFVDEFYDAEKVAYIRDDTLITFSNNQAGRGAYYDSSNNFVKRVWINSGGTVQPPNYEKYAKQKLGWTMAENPDYAVIFTPVDDSLFVNEKSYLGTDGELVSNDGFSTTDYLEVPSNVKYLTANPNVANVTSRLCFYDVNKTLVQRFAVQSAVGTVLYGEVPSNAVYFRFDKASNVSAYSPFVKF